MSSRGYALGFHNALCQPVNNIQAIVASCTLDSPAMCGETIGGQEDLKSAPSAAVAGLWIIDGACRSRIMRALQGNWEVRCTPLSPSTFLID